MLFLIIFVLIFPKIYAQTYRVLDYGAVGDGKTDDTQAVRKALAAAEATNGGKVVFDSGYTFLTGCFNVTSNVILDVEGKILAQDNNSFYVLIAPLPWMGGGQDYENTGYYEWQPIVRSYNARNITITGGGVIDGRGQIWWDCTNTANTTKNEPPCDGKSRPQLVRLTNTVDIEIYNITLKDSPAWTLHLANTSNAHVHDMWIYAPHKSQNTDGIDIDCSDNVLIENVYYEGSDDAIAVKSGVDYLGRTFGRPTENVLIRNFSSQFSQGLAIGSEVAGGARNISFQDCYMNNSHFGVNIKSHRYRGGVIEDITYSNIYLTNTEYPIILTLTYYLGGTAKVPPQNQTATPKFRNFNINNIYCTNCKYGWYLDGLPESVIQNVIFYNITLNVTDDYIVENECHNIVGKCDNSSVHPKCPYCLEKPTCICPASGGWYQSTTNPCNCYKFISTQTDWNSANNVCTDQSATLPSVDSAFENSELLTQAQKLNGCAQVFLGLTQTQNSTQWTWINGDNSTYANWRSGYPQNNPNNKCSQLNTNDGTWTNVDCASSGCFVCEIKANI